MSYFFVVKTTNNHRQEVLYVAEGIGRINLLDAKKPEQWTDYTYEELLDLVYGIMREKNPELASGKKKVRVFISGA